MKRFALVLAFILAACEDPPTTTPTEPSGPAADSAEVAAISLRMTLEPPMAHLARDYWPTRTIQFEAVIQRGDDTLEIHPDSVEWLVTDTAVAKVDSVGIVTPRDGGYVMLVAKWKAVVSAAAIIVEDLKVTTYGSYMTPGVGGVTDYVAGRPIFFQAIVTADTANDWIPAAAVTTGYPASWDTVRTFPMDAPEDGLPTSLSWGDWEPLDSTFRVVIPGDSVKQNRLKRLYVRYDWNTRDGAGPWGYGGNIVEPPDFHLVIVPVIWDSIPDYRIMDWTKGLTADSFRIHEIREMLPVRHDYPVTVAADSFVTKQNLTTYDGWKGLLAEIDSIRKADTTRAYYYGAIVRPKGSYIAGIGYVGYPASAGTLGVIAHEIGHNMNLRHAPCGGAGGPDPNFPYEDGKTGKWGFSFWNMVRKDPEKFYDMMSYCNPRWISDYHFNRALTYRLYNEDRWWDDDTDLEPPRIVVDSIKPGWPGIGPVRH